MGLTCSRNSNRWSISALTFERRPEADPVAQVKEVDASRGDATTAPVGATIAAAAVTDEEDEDDDPVLLSNIAESSEPP